MAGGRSVEELATTLDDMVILPLYTRAERDGAGDPTGFPGLAPFVRGGAANGRQGWDVRQWHELSNTDVASAILADLEAGATSILLDTGAADLDRLAPAVAGVHLDLASLHLMPGWRYVEATEALREVWANRGLPPGARLAVLGMDPLGALARHGGLLRPLDESIHEAASIVAEIVSDHSGVVAMSVDASVYADAAATEVDELAYSLATGVAYLRAMTAAGLDVGGAFRQIEFTYSATADTFVTIAKFRAARRLWGRVGELCEVPPAVAPQRQHALTSAAMMSRHDPWLNMIRNTVAGFSAGIAGARAVTVRPFDVSLGLSDEFARRTARNTQLLLLEESNLGRVIDPGGGSCYLEDLTEQLARRAWSAFQRIESAGGMAETLVSGEVAADLEASWHLELERLREGEDVVVGVNRFHDPDVARLERPARPAVPEPVSPGVSIDALPLRCLDEPLVDTGAAT